MKTGEALITSCQSRDVVMADHIPIIIQRAYASVQTAINAGAERGFWEGRRVLSLGVPTLVPGGCRGMPSPETSPFL